LITLGLGVGNLYRPREKTKDSHKKWLRLKGLAKGKTFTLG